MAGVWLILSRQSNLHCKCDPQWEENRRQNHIRHELSGT
jgi:hypothetical protein